RECVQCSVSSVVLLPFRCTLKISLTRTSVHGGWILRLSSGFLLSVRKSPPTNLFPAGVWIGVLCSARVCLVTLCSFGCGISVDDHSSTPIRHRGRCLLRE